MSCLFWRMSCLWECEDSGKKWNTPNTKVRDTIRSAGAILIRFIPLPHPSGSKPISKLNDLITIGKRRARNAPEERDSPGILSYSSASYAGLDGMTS